MQHDRMVQSKVKYVFYLIKAGLVDFIGSIVYNGLKEGDHMCTESQLHNVTSSVAEEAKRIFGEMLDAVVLYGSYARGDNDEESDIDIMVRINCSQEDLNKYRFVLSGFTSALSVENDVTVSVIIVDTPTYDRYKNHLPFYENVEKEGMKIA